MDKISLEESDIFMSNMLNKYEDVTEDKINISMCFGTGDNFKEFIGYHKDACILRIVCNTLYKDVRFTSLTLAIDVNVDKDGFKTLVARNFIIDGVDYADIIGVDSLTRIVNILEDKIGFLTVLIKTFNKFRYSGKEPTNKNRDIIFTSVNDLVNVLYDVRDEKLNKMEKNNEIRRNKENCNC